MSNAKKVPVSRRALIQRLNRHLAKEGLALKVTRGGRAYDEFGEFYVVDDRRGNVTAAHVDLEKLARKEMVLKPYEYLAD